MKKLMVVLAVLLFPTQAMACGGGGYSLASEGVITRFSATHLDLLDKMIASVAVVDYVGGIIGGPLYSAVQAPVYSVMGDEEATAEATIDVAIGVFAPGPLQDVADVAKGVGIAQQAVEAFSD